MMGGDGGRRGNVPAPTSGRGAQDYDGHHYGASSGGHGVRNVDGSTGGPHPLGGRFAYIVQVKDTGEQVTIVAHREEGQRVVLIADDGREFVAAAHGIGVVAI